MSNMDMIKININEKLYDVVDLSDYMNNKDAYIQNQTAIEVDGVALPIISSNDRRNHGIILGDLFHKISMPEDPVNSEYHMSKAIDLSRSKDIGELLEKQEAVRNIEYEILTSANSIFKPMIGPDDSAAIRALKEAVIAKHIDLDKYEPRFGPNYPNDKRLLHKDRISIQMLERVCNALDIKATLTLTDESPDVPNPMGTTITVDLTGVVDGDSYDE